MIYHLPFLYIYITCCGGVGIFPEDHRPEGYVIVISWQKVVYQLIYHFCHDITIIYPVTMTAVECEVFYGNIIKWCTYKPSQ